MARSAPKPAEAVTPAAGLRRTKVPSGDVAKSVRVVSAAQFAEMLAISRNTVTKWIRDGMPHESDEKAYRIHMGRADYVDPGYTPQVSPAYVSGVLPTYNYVGTLNGDVEYVLSATPAEEPVDAFRLSDPRYVVTDVSRANAAGDQIAQVSRLIANNENPQGVAQAYPSTLDVTLRNLRSQGVLSRQYTCHAQMTWSPRGLDLVNGGEP